MDLLYVFYQTVYTAWNEELTESLETAEFSESDDVILLYGNMVYRLAFARMQNRHDADDIFQEVFLRYVRRAPKFESMEHGKAWFLRTTLNCCKTVWASAWHRKTTDLSEAESCTVTVETEDAQMLADALMQLTPKYRVVLHLYYYEGLTAEEIARLQHVPAGTIRMQLSRGRTMLKEILLQEHEDLFVKEGVSYDSK